MGLPEHSYRNSGTRDSDAWGSPDDVLEPIQKHFGPIGLDPCADEHRQFATHNFYEPRDGDGIMLPWSGYGLVYVNPPYSDCERWTWKAARDGDEVISLLPVRTSAGWWWKYVWPCDGIVFFRRRLWFHGAQWQATFHCALSYWGIRSALLVEAFADCEVFLRCNGVLQHVHSPEVT